MLHILQKQTLSNMKTLFWACHILHGSKKFVYHFAKFEFAFQNRHALLCHFFHLTWGSDPLGFIRKQAFQNLAN